jgi:hypothetical protein
MKTTSLTSKILDIMRAINAPICVKDVFRKLSTEDARIKYKSVADLMIRLSVEGHLDTLGNGMFVIKPSGEMSGSLLDVINKLKDIHLRLGNIPVYSDNKLKLEEYDRFLIVRVS